MYCIRLRFYFIFLSIIDYGLDFRTSCILIRHEMLFFCVVLTSRQVGQNDMLGVLIPYYINGALTSHDLFSPKSYKSGSSKREERNTLMSLPVYLDLLLLIFLL